MFFTSTAKIEEKHFFPEKKIIAKYYLEHVEFTFENRDRNCLIKGGQLVANYPKKVNECELFQKIFFPQNDHLVMKKVVLTTLPVIFQKKPEIFCLKSGRLEEGKIF